jgi:predicted amidohydrolase YtcJ
MFQQGLIRHVWRLIYFSALVFPLGGPLHGQGVVYYADHVLHNGKVLTVDDEFTITQGVAIRDGKLVEVGSDRQVLRHVGPQTTVIDLQGRMVLPGLVDTHTHAHENSIGHYASQAVPELRAQTVRGSNYEEFLTGIRDIADKTPEGRWAVVRLEPSDLANDFWLKHTSRDLDKVAEGKLILINQGVRGMLTGKGLEVVKERYGGYESDLMKLPGLADENGQITGRFRAAVVRALQQDLIMLGKEEILKDAYYKEMLDLAKYGVTTWSSTLQPIVAFKLFAELDQEGKLPVRLGYSHSAGFTSFPHSAGFYERLGPIQGHGTDHLWAIGATPANTDGAYPNICASPDAPAEIKAREQCFAVPGGTNRAGFEAIVQSGNRLTGTHVSGELGLDQMMDAIEAGSREAGLTPEQIRAKRHSTDHCDYNPRPDQIERGVRLGIYFSCKSNGIWRGNVKGFLSDYGEQYLDWIVPVKSILEAGGKAVMEIDHHLTDEESPFLDIQTFITREDDQGQVLGPDERIDRVTALKMITRWAAEYVLREDVLGSLEVDKWADLIVVDKDYLTIPENQIKEIKVLLTLVGGKPVYVGPEFLGQVSPMLD